MLHRNTYLRIGLLIGVSALLYGPFLANPLVFDDLSFFQGRGIRQYAAGNVPFSLRWFSYATLGLTHHLAGQDPRWYRVGNLLLHVAVGISLYLLIAKLLRLSRVSIRNRALSAEWLAFFATLLFVLNPVAVYGVGYLIERSIVMATLFALLMWLALLRGLETMRWRWLWLSAGCYFLSVFSKEHAVMAPAVALALAILYYRSNREDGRRWRDDAFRLVPAFLLYAVIAASVVYAKSHLLGTTYELQEGNMLEGMESFITSLEHPYLLSVITQCWLFFKYLFLWLVPDPAWMSIDMREPFATTLTAWPMILGAVGYVVLFLTGAALLWRGGAPGLAGLAMLAPAVLFMTEFSTVRIQEQFVLYRSYLWTPLLFAALPVLMRGLPRRMAVAMLIVLPFALAALSLDRLVTFGNPILLWDDAVKLTAGREHLFGTARTIYVRGYYYNQYAFHTEAIADFDRALALQPNYAAALKERGRAQLSLGHPDLALIDFNRAIEIKPNYGQAYMGRAEVLEQKGSTGEALQDFKHACDLGWGEACKHLASATQGK